MVRPASMSRTPRRLPDRVDSPVPALPGLSAAVALATSLGTSSSSSSSPSPSPASTAAAAAAASAGHRYPSSSSSATQSTTGPSSSALAPPGPHSSNASAVGLARPLASPAQTLLPSALAATHPHLRRAMRRTEPFASRARGAARTRAAAARACDAATASRDRESITLARARLDVAELVVRALEVESARAARDKHYAQSSSFNSSANSIRPARSTPGATHDPAALLDTLEALDADIAFALSAHDRAKKRLRKALAALADASIHLAETSLACTQAEGRIDGDRIIQAKSGTSIRKEQPSSNVHAGKPTQSLNKAAPALAGLGAPRKPARKETSRTESDSEAIFQRFRDVDNGLQSTFGNGSGRGLSDPYTCQIASASSSSCCYQGRPPCVKHHTENCSDRVQPALRARSFVGSGSSDFQAESDEALSYATDSSLSGPPSPCDPVLYSFDVSHRNRSDSPPTSPFSDDSGGCNHMQKSMSELFWSPNIPSLASMSSLSTGPSSSNHVQTLASHGSTRAVEHGASYPDLKSKHIHPVSHGMIPRSAIAGTATGRPSPQIGPLSGSSLRQKMLSSVMAPRRTLARLQLARIRVPTAVKNLWSEANYHVVAALAHVPTLAAHTAYIMQMHFVTFSVVADPEATGILGPYPVRTSEESAREYISRLNAAVQHAIQLLSELVARESEIVQDLKLDRNAVLDDLTQAEHIWDAFANVRAISGSSYAPGHRTPARSLSELGVHRRRSSFEFSQLSSRSLRLG
jgi:hypothetical protein